MNKEFIIFRVDIGEYSGLGHFYRCFALAQIINPIANIKFSLPLKQVQVLNSLKEHNFSFEVIEDFYFFMQKTKEKSIIVLDGYNYGYELQKQIIDGGHYLILIDDLANGKYYANVIINSDVYVKVEDYMINNSAKFYLGLKYLIVRPNFYENRNNYKSKKEKNWIISFGGTSNLSLYFKFLLYINDFNNNNFVICEKVVIFLNDSDADKDEMDFFISSNYLNFKTEIFQALNANQLIFHMDKAKFGILPGSGILREAVLRNVFCITGSFVDNHKPLAKFFHDSEIAISINDFNSVDYSLFTENVLKISRFCNSKYQKIDEILSLNQKENLKSIFVNIMQ